MKLALGFVFVSLLAYALGSRQNWVRSNPLAVSSAKPPISATSYLGCGVDAGTGELGLAPLFTWSYSGKQSWTPPSGNGSYAVPDQMAVSPFNEMRETVVQGSYDTYSEFLSSYVSWFKFDVSLGYKNFSAGFDYDKQLGYVHKMMSEGNSSLMHGNHLWNFYISTLYPPSVLKQNPMLALAISKLPPTIQSQADWNDYDAFRVAFGTHYLARAIFGARIDFNSALSNQMTQSYSNSWVQEQYGFYFHFVLFNVSGGGFENKSSINVSQAFLQGSNSNVTFYGGDPTLADLNNLTAWTGTIESMTYPLNCTLMGTWELIADPTTSTTMRNFVASYLNSSPSSWSYPNHQRYTVRQLNQDLLKKKGLPLMVSHHHH